MISAFVICYNRADTIGTCLRALRFVDELIVVDKSSTDGSSLIARECADHVLSVPWTSTVEETRAVALSLCRHDWILFMDDDECLSPGSGQYIRKELERPVADIYEFALRHYILGRHDERAYYWPEHHVRMFRRGMVTFSSTIHAGVQHHSGRIGRFPLDIAVHHFSNANVAGWIEKSNRYTANSNRAGLTAGPDGFAAFARKRIDYWFNRTDDDAHLGYPAAAALLRSIYDMIDALKAWEDGSGVAGADLLRIACDRLEHGELLSAR